MVKKLESFYDSAHKQCIQPKSAEAIKLKERKGKANLKYPRMMAENKIIWRNEEFKGSDVIRKVKENVKFRANILGFKKCTVNDCEWFRGL